MQRGDRFVAGVLLLVTQDGHAVVAEVDGSRDQVRIIVDEQAVTRIEAEKIAARRVAKFTAGADLKKAVNRGK